MVSYSTLTPQEVRREIQAIKRHGRQLRKSPAAARAFLIKAGILTRAGKLAPRYR